MFSAHIDWLDLNILGYMKEKKKTMVIIEVKKRLIILKYHIFSTFK